MAKINKPFLAILPGSHRQRMILSAHLQYYQEIFALPEFLVGPILSFGLQDIERGVRFDGRRYRNLTDLLDANKIKSFSLDLFDARATFHHDMNTPLHIASYGQFRTVIDIGSIEHIFDTRQCLENCLRLVALGGHYMVHTPVNGYFAHGMHVFHPSALVSALELNGFRIIYRKFSNENGTPVQDPSEGGDVIMWLVAVKVREFEHFTPPQQNGWSLVYRNAPPPAARIQRHNLPCSKVVIRIVLPHECLPGHYECSLMTPRKQQLTYQKTPSEILDGFVTLSLRLDLANHEPGDYLLGVRNPRMAWTYYHVSLLAEFPSMWLEL